MSVYPTFSSGDLPVQNAPISLQPISNQSQLPVFPGNGYGNVEQSGNQEYPDSLAIFAQIDSLVVQQNLELLEILCGCETANKYKILTVEGLQLFSAVEDTDCCTRQFCGNIRPFEMTIKDRKGAEVIHLSRPLACGTYLFPCCLQSIQVFCPPGELAGSVEELWSCTPTFLIRDHENQVVLKVEGPKCGYNCGCCHVEFGVFEVEGGRKVGKIEKKWGGLLKEMFSDVDCFGLSFPRELELKLKAVLVGALFLIDFIVFERAGNNNFLDFL